ncbi:MAG: hypothetical protein QOH23_1421, partial [Gaiellaceae bacterium]|nr:hypothetical protein [Gaiellaceae bacterium]
MIGGFIDNVRTAAAFGDSKGDRLRLGRYYAQMCISERFASVRAPAPIRVPLAPDGHQVVISD